jgi:hypothetical protein
VGTATYGWAKPLEALVSEMRHGVVDKGFRGEFITKVLLCMAVEDAQRRNWGNSTSRHEWKYSQPITVAQFLNSLLRTRGKGNEAVSVSIVEPKFSTGRKRERPTDDEPSLRTKKIAKMTFDDSTSDDKDEIRIDDSDGIPTPDDSFIDYIDRESELFQVFGREKQKQQRSSSLTGLLHGLVFFNHFIKTETTLRPSLLLKAWNREAAIMTKPGAVGVDFVIPVVMSANGGPFGPFIGPWSESRKPRQIQLLHISSSRQRIVLMHAIRIQ